MQLKMRISGITFLIFTTVGYEAETLSARHRSASARVFAGTAVTISASVDSSNFPQGAKTNCARHKKLILNRHRLAVDIEIIRWRAVALQYFNFDNRLRMFVLAKVF